MPDADRGGSRFLVQYLEPSPDVESAGPAALAVALREALAVLPATDVALGWRLSAAQLEAVRAAIPDGVAVWRWVPVFAGGWHASDTGPLAVGPGGVPPRPFRDMDDFRFRCLTRPEVVDEAIDRVLALVDEAGATGALLDRIRWPSPSDDPATELCCFCEACAARAAGDGLDLAAVAAKLARASRDGAGRRVVVEAIFGRRPDTLIGSFMAWRAGRVGSAVGRVAGALRSRGLRVGLDVFSPGVALTVGQDLARLPAADLVKAMTYLDAQGPASLPFELAGYARWLAGAGEPAPGELAVAAEPAPGELAVADEPAPGELAVADEPAPGDFLAGLTRFRLPVGGAAPEIGADILAHEARRLTAAVGQAGVVGLDVVEVPGVLGIDDALVGARVAALRGLGVGIAPSWDARLMSRRRLEAIAEAWGRAVR